MGKTNLDYHDERCEEFGWQIVGLLIFFIGIGSQCTEIVDQQTINKEMRFCNYCTTFRKTVEFFETRLDFLVMAINLVTLFSLENVFNKEKRKSLGML